jgi:peptide/nickel transport system permease protein
MTLGPVTEALEESSTKAPTVRRRSVLPAGQLFHNRKAVVGGALLLLLILLALLAPLISPGDPSRFGTDTLQAPSLAHPLGTTLKGQDVFAMTVWGARVSLLVGFIVGIGATFIGAVIGLLAAYVGRLFDDVLSLITNIFLLIPGLPFLVVVAAFLPPGPTTIAFVLVLTGWAGSARAIRSQALSIRTAGYVDSAIVIGEHPLRIMFREMLPNMASVLMGTFLGGVVFGIGAEAGLEFLGLGDVGVASWGTNLYWAVSDGAFLTGAWWEFVPSGTAIALVAFGLAMLNYAVDEITNPRLRLGGRRRRRGTTR